MNPDQSFIPLSVPNLGGNEQKYAADAIGREWVSTAGSYVDAFERNFAAYAKVPAAVSCQSGTAALHLALLEAGVGAGDLVVVPTLTFIAAVNPVRYVGADPVFMDCDESLCLDPAKLARYLERECESRTGGLYDRGLGRPIRALVAVHVFGNGAGMDGIMELAGKYDLPVVEDATEAVGTWYTAGRYAGRMAGTIGDFGAYSFNGNKIMTTGGGGMLVARDADKLAHAKHLSTQAKTDGVYYRHDAVGYNYRMTNLQAAVGVAQLERLEEFVAAKAENYRLYRECGVELLPFAANVRPNHWFYSHPATDRDGLIRFLTEKRIQIRPIWELVHTQPMYRQCRAYEIETAPEYHRKIVNLPCGSNLSGEDVRRVAAAVGAFGEGGAHVDR